MFFSILELSVITTCQKSGSVTFFEVPRSKRSNGRGKRDANLEPKKESEWRADKMENGATFPPFFVFWSRRERKIDGDVPSWGKGCQLKQDGVCSNQNCESAQCSKFGFERGIELIFEFAFFAGLPRSFIPPLSPENIHLTCESDGWFSNWYLSPWTRPASSKINSNFFLR